MRGLHPTFAAPVVAPFRQRRRPPASSGGRPIAACGPRLPPPSSYPALRAEAFAATGAALAAGVLLAEVQFPAVPNMATAALNEVLDANRAFAREFARGFVARGWRVNAVFGDVGEARLAVEAWGDDKRVGVRAIPRKGDSRPEGYLRGEGDGVCIVVSPGFNVAEWIDMERLEIEGGDPIVVVNGDLDKTRGGYYPRLFYPGLWKMFSNGGNLMRRFGEDWTLRYTSINGGDATVLASWKDRPEFRDVEGLLRIARTEELVQRK